MPRGFIQGFIEKDSQYMLEGLNEQQTEAVSTVDGPLLVLAGAGSGKTRVLTSRIAYLVGEKGVPPGNILAMTFTNKAAGEMKERVQALLERPASNLWIGTFHSLCARILRRECTHVGLNPSFSIFDSEDQLTLLRQVVRDQELSDKQYAPRQVRSRISSAKNQMIDAAEYARTAGNFYEQGVARIYRQYEDALRRSNAVDFDDLLVLSVRVLRENPEVLNAYQSRFRYCLIDEYQDTNRPQYLFAKLLAEAHGNICVVGDDDQSIYAWRGADLRNILDFEKDYPNARVIRLERNYRSTQTILDAGNAVIRHNLGRKGKELWTDRGSGEKVVLRRCQDERDEAAWLASTVSRLQSSGHRLRNVAVLYRTNAQSRALEEGLRRAAIPYLIVGGLKFYERKEIKDILAYLRLVVNPADAVSFVRAVNTPKRGIGATSLQKLIDFANGEGISAFQALQRLPEVTGLASRAANALAGFRDLILPFQQDVEGVSAARRAAEIVEASGIPDDLKEMGPVEHETRIENVRELLAGIEEFCERAEDPSLDGFLREVSLLSDIDQWSPESDAVTMMTLHSAKGLEFPTVFVTGLEEGLLPIIRSDQEPSVAEEAVEEERRLFYVGITRARERLLLTHASVRARFGGARPSHPSRFISEIPERLVVAEARSSAVSSDTGGATVNARPPEVRKQATPPRPVSVQTGSGPVSLEVGAWVVHPSWGRGQIRERSGNGQNAKVTVQFTSGAAKTVVVKYANFSPAGAGTSNG